uniref:gamma-glutamyltransferase family protein n=1 Tax=Methylobacterium sp. B1 TaxID=91459 RepID=UPI0005BA6589
MPETPVFTSAAVAAPHSLAAQAGQTVLAQGGNAIEAMVAMAASIAVVYPHMNGIGGDGFWLVRERGGRVRGIEACGPAGRLATIPRYREKGYDAIPARGPDAMVTVAGAVGGWRLALELARALGGRLPLETLFADAIGQARAGVAISPSEARYVPQELDTLHDAPNFAATFLKDGKPYPAGETRALPRLADTLEQLAHAGLGDFYRGDIGREIAADLERLGAPVTRADLEAFAAVERAPLSIRRRDATLYNFPPPTQGLAALLILGIFDRLNVSEPERTAHYHGLIEATKRAFAIRDRVVTDFARLRHDPAAFL